MTIACDIVMPIIGIHRSALVQKFGTPRQPNLVDIVSVIEFVAPYDNLQAFVGLRDFSHIWVLWHFHYNKPQAHFMPQVRPPRLGGNQKVGVFATRSMYRPSALGMSVVRLLQIESVDNKVRLHIMGADMIDGTPIVDIKPYLPYSDSIQEARCADIVAPSVKAAILSVGAKLDFSDIKQRGALDDEDLSVIQKLIAQDPRPAYKRHQDVVFVMRYQTVDVHFAQILDGAFAIVAMCLINGDGCGQ